MLTIDKDQIKIIELRRELETLLTRIDHAEKILDWARASAHSVQEMIFEMEEERWN